MNKYYYHPITGEKVIIKDSSECIFVYIDSNGDVICVLEDYDCHCIDCPLKECKEQEEVKE